jgi:hypothetical protein
MPTRHKIIVIAGTLLMLLSVVPALAAPKKPTGAMEKPNPLNALANAGTAASYDVSNTASDPTAIASNIIGTLLGLLGLVFIILTIYGGFLWMTAQGNEEQITKAKKILMNATIGIIVISMAYAITYFVFSTLIPKTRTDQTNMFQ